MQKLCAYSPEGKPLPEPLGDTEAEVIEAFCYLSEISREQFKADGYTVGPAPSVH